MSGSGYWECVLCAQPFTSLEGWKAHVDGRASGTCKGWPTHAPATPLTEADVRRIVTDMLTAWEAAQRHIKEPEPRTMGRCDNHKRPGGCPLHNLQCGYPKCDEFPDENR